MHTLATIQKPRETLTVVIPFHAGDQTSAGLLLDLLSQLEEGVPTHYILRYADDPTALRIGDHINRFLSYKHATLDIAPTGVVLPEALAANDPNQAPVGGNHTIRTPDQKRRIFCWNAMVYECIQQHDRFLIVEPDCVVLRQKWAMPFMEAWAARECPFVGHLKRGTIGGRLVPTHYAGCSLYDGAALRTLALKESFTNRTENPWWPLRNTTGTTCANNAFYGPVISGYDLSYDYFLFALWFRHATGSNNPADWPLNTLTSREDLVLCDFRSRLTVQQVFERHLGKVSIMHGLKDDAVRREALREVALGRIANNLFMNKERRTAVA